MSYYTPDHPFNLKVQQFDNTIVLTWEKPLLMNGCELSGYKIYSYLDPSNSLVEKTLIATITNSEQRSFVLTKPYNNVSSAEFPQTLPNGTQQLQRYSYFIRTVGKAPKDAIAYPTSSDTNYLNGHSLYSTMPEASIIYISPSLNSPNISKTKNAPVSNLVEISGWIGPTLVYSSPDNLAAYIYLTTGISGGNIIKSYNYSLNNGLTYNSFSVDTLMSPIKITGLTNGQTYQIKLRAVNETNQSTESNMIEVTPTNSSSVTPWLYFNPADISCYSGTGTTVNNIGSYGSYGSYGSLSGTKAAAVTYVDGSNINRKVFDFNGANGSVISFPQFNFGTVLSVCAWVYPRNKADINGLFTNAVANVAPSGFKFQWNWWRNGNRAISFQAGNGITGKDNYTILNVIQYNEWQHVSYVFDQVNRKIIFFWNGTPVLVSIDITPVADIGMNQVFNIGGYVGGSYTMNAQLGYIKVYNSLLSASDIKAEYNSNKFVFTGILPEPEPEPEPEQLYNYPPNALQNISPTTDLTYDVSGLQFKISSSTNFDPTTLSHSFVHLFNDDITDVWASQANDHINTTYAGLGYNGAWIRFELGKPIIPKSIVLTSRTGNVCDQRPKNFRIYGTNEPVVGEEGWTELYDSSGVFWDYSGGLTPNQTKEFIFAPIDISYANYLIVFNSNYYEESTLLLSEKNMHILPYISLAELKIKSPINIFFVQEERLTITNLLAVADDSSIFLSWTPPTQQPTSYTITVYQFPMGDIITKTVDGITNTAIIAGLVNKRHYKVKILADGIEGSEEVEWISQDAENIDSILIPREPITAPLNIEITQNGDQLNISWLKPQKGDVNGYKIELMYIDQEDPEVTHTIIQDTVDTQITIDNLEYDIEYKIRIQAYYNSIVGLYSNYIYISLVQPAPVGLVLDSLYVNELDVTVNWHLLEGVARFNLTAIPEGKRQHKAVQRNAVNVTSPYTFTNLIAGVQYRIRIDAVNSGGSVDLLTPAVVTYTSANINELYTLSSNSQSVIKAGDNLFTGIRKESVAPSVPLTYNDEETGVGVDITGLPSQFTVVVGFKEPSNSRYKAHMFIKVYDAQNNLVEGREDIEIAILIDMGLLSENGVELMGVERRGSPNEPLVYYGKAYRTEGGKYMFRTTTNSEYLFYNEVQTPTIQGPTVQQFVQVSSDRNVDNFIEQREGAILASGYRRGAYDASIYLKMQLGRR